MVILTNRIDAGTMPGNPAPPEAGIAPSNGHPADYATPNVPRYNMETLPPPPPPSSAHPTLFSHTNQPNIARSLPAVLSRSLVEHNPSQAASALITLLSTNVGGSLSLHPTTPEERVSVVQRMCEVGTPGYLKAFSSDIRGREILAAWLSDATPPRKADIPDDSETWKEVLCPLLELLLRLPIELDHLKDHVGLGKLITGAQKRARSERARKLADDVKEKWSALVPARPNPGEARDSPPLAPKRPAPGAPSEGVKRARSTTPPSSVRSPADPISPARPSGAARPASSLLPSSHASAERKPSPQLTEARIPMRTGAAAKPTADPLAATRRSIRSTSNTTNANKDLAGFMSLIDQQPAQSSSGPAAAPSAAPMERKKRKKGVHWKDYDGMPLVAIKVIEPAVYDEDRDLSTKGTGALDIEEGGAFRQAHAEMDEQIDWYPPRELLLHDPESGPLPERGRDSQTKIAQEEREKAHLLAVYMHPHEIPASPAEPDEFVLSFAAHMPPPRPMTTGLPGEPAPAPATSDVPVPDFSAMMSQMGPGPDGPPMPPMPPMPFDPAMLQMFMQNAPNTGNSTQDTPTMPMPPWGGGGDMPFPFPFPSSDMMPAMGRGPTAPAKDKPEPKEGKSRSSRRSRKHNKS